MSNAAVLLFNPVFCLFKFYLKAFRRKQSSRYSFGLPLRKNHSTKYLSKMFSRLNKFGSKYVRKKVAREKLASLGSLLFGFQRIGYFYYML